MSTTNNHKNDNNPGRGIVYSSDVQEMMGGQLATAQKRLRKIRTQLNKPSYSLITVQEFCQCTGLPEEFVKQYVK